MVNLDIINQFIVRNEYRSNTIIRTHGGEKYCKLGESMYEEKLSNM